MKVITRKLPKDHNIFLFGDDHEGTVLRHNDGFSQLIDMMHSPYGGLPASRNYGLDSGDIIEAICVDDPRYDGLTTDGNILRQIQRAVNSRKAIAKKLICIMEGNHPLKLWRFGRITESVCKELNVEYGTWSSIVEYRNYDDSVMYRHYAAHGFKAINSRIDDPVDRRNSMKRGLRRQLQYKADNCILMTMGHCHQMLCYEPEPSIGIVNGNSRVKSQYPKADPTSNYIPPHLRWYVSTGCFMKTYGDGFSGYVEKAGYDPAEIGFYVARIRGGEIEGIDPVRI